MFHLAVQYLGLAVLSAQISVHFSTVVIPLQSTDEDTFISHHYDKIW